MTTVTSSNEHRYKIQLWTPRKRPITIETSDDRSRAIEKARSIRGQVVDTQTGKIFRISLERWIKPSTAAVIDGTYSSGRHVDRIAEDTLLADIPVWLEPHDTQFSAEGC